MFYHKTMELNQIKSNFLIKKKKNKRNLIDINFDIVYKNQNTIDLKKKYTLEKKKIKFTKENYKSIKNLDEWYSNILNKDSMIEKYKNNMNKKVRKMISLICPIEIKKNLNTKLKKENLPKIKNLPQIKNEGLQKLIINKYNTELVQNIIKKSLIRDIRNKSISLNTNQGFKLIERRSKSLINSYNSLKNSVKLGNIDSKKIIKKIDIKLLPKIKRSFFSKNILKNSHNNIILGRFRVKDENDIKNVVKLKIQRNFGEKRNQNLSLVNNFIELSAKIKKIQILKESLFKIREINKKLKKKIEKEEINLFKMVNNQKLKKKKNSEKDTDIIKFNKFLFQGKNIEIKRLEMKKNKLKIKNKKKILKRTLLNILQNLKYFKLVNKRIKY